MRQMMTGFLFSVRQSWKSNNGYATIQSLKIMIQGNYLYIKGAFYDLKK